jgi:hypothetical protein
MSAIEVIKRENKRNKSLQAELKRKEESQSSNSEEIEHMIAKLKIQVEEDKIIKEALKEWLEERDKIIGNLEADIVTLRKDLKRKTCRIVLKFWIALLIVRDQIMTSPDLDKIKQKMDQAPKQ